MSRVFGSGLRRRGCVEVRSASGRAETEWCDDALMMFADRHDAVGNDPTQEDSGFPRPDTNVECPSVRRGADRREGLKTPLRIHTKRSRVAGITDMVVGDADDYGEVTFLNVPMKAEVVTVMAVVRVGAAAARRGPVDPRHFPEQLCKEVRRIEGPQSRAGHRRLQPPVRLAAAIFFSVVLADAVGLGSRPHVGCLCCKRCHRVGAKERCDEDSATLGERSSREAAPDRIVRGCRHAYSVGPKSGGAVNVTASTHCLTSAGTGSSGSSK